MDIVTLVAGLALDIFTGVPIDQLEIPSSVAVTCDTSLNECTYNKCLCEAEYTLATSFYLVIDLLQGSPTMSRFLGKMALIDFSSLKFLLLTIS